MPTKQVLRSDPALLERIMRNLVANALRYTEHGGVVVGARRRGDRVAIEVWDSGSGIEAAEREHIFEEFYQIGNPERDRTRGLGLGLAIVRRLADLLGHEVEVASRVGRGSVFRVLAGVGDPRCVATGRARGGGKRRLDAWSLYRGRRRRTLGAGEHAQTAVGVGMHSCHSG